MATERQIAANRRNARKIPALALVPAEDELVAVPTDTVSAPGSCLARSALNILND